MKRAYILAVLTGCAGSPAGPDRAPEIEVARPDGRRVQGTSLWQGRPVLLVFMTSW